MARFTAILGALSGKLSGSVFANNRYGPYVRTWIKPVQPGTTAQHTTRSNFSTAAGGWHALTDSAKALWNSFGNTFYVGKKKSLVGGYTGFNAFTAMRTAVGEANTWSTPFSMATPACSLTTVAFTMPGSTPPAAAISGSISTSASLPLTIAIDQATFTSVGVLSCRFKLGATQATAPLMVDPTTLEAVGIAIFATLPKYQKNNYKGYKAAVALAYLNPMTIGASWTTTNTWFLNFTVPAARIAALKSWYIAGDAVQLTAYTVSITGQQKAIGTVDVKIT